MTKRETYEQKTEEMVQPILAENACELVDVEYVKEGSDYFLRLYIDKEGGVTIDDCEVVSRALEEKLDAADLIPDAYILEVSSPGLDRPLKKEKDFVRSKGKDVEVRCYKAVSGSREWRGALTSWDDETVTITPEGAEPVTFARKEIALIRLAFDF